MSKGIVKNLVVLTLITVIAGLGLALTYNFTKDAMAEAERQEMLKSIKSVLPQDAQGNALFNNSPDEMSFDVEIDSEETGGKKKITLFPGLKDGELIGFAIKASSPLGYGGEVGFMIGVDPDGTIIDTYILKMAETPGLGTKINEEPFKGQFPGKSIEAGDAITLKKDDSQKGDLDAVTGATISSRAMAKTVRETVKYYYEHRNELKAKVAKVKEPTGDIAVTKEEGGEQ